MIALIVAASAAVGAWFAENAAIHAMGYGGFAGAGWSTAIIIPIGAAAWAWSKAQELTRRRSG